MIARGTKRLPAREENSAQGSATCHSESLSGSRKALAVIFAPLTSAARDQDRQSADEGSASEFRCRSNSRASDFSLQLESCLQLIQVERFNLRSVLGGALRRPT